MFRLTGSFYTHNEQPLNYLLPHPNCLLWKLAHYQRQSCCTTRITGHTIGNDIANTIEGIIHMRALSNSSYKTSSYKHPLITGA